jgi:hypothetical protein
VPEGVNELVALSPHVRYYGMRYLAMSDTSNRKVKLVRRTVPFVVAGLTVGMCPKSDEKEKEHVEVQQQNPVTPVGGAAIVFQSTSTSSLTSTTAILSPSIWKYR